MPRPHANAPTSLTVNHALHVGQTIGLLMKAGLDVTPVVDDHGDYTNRILLTTPTLATPITLLIPAPPDGWKFDPLA